MERWFRIRPGPTLFAAALVAAAAANAVAGQDPTALQATNAQALGRFLLPAAVQNRLGLTEEQKGRIAKLEQEFARKHQQAVGSLPEELDQTRQGLLQARQKEDRTAFREGQQRLRGLMTRLAPLREDFEPDLFTVLNEEQQRTYKALKPELQRPAVLFGMQPVAGPGPPPRPVDLSALKPLTDMGQSDYHGHAGGLYPDGKNERPAAHEAAGRALAAKIQALDEAGKPSAEGRIVLLTIGMSNTSQAAAGFKQVADGDPEKNLRVLIVNGAQGGQTAARTQDPDDHASGTTYWTTVDERLRSAGVTRAQVQAVWLKQADAGPTQGFPEYAETLEGELARIVQVLHQRFPNLKLVYLSSRTYGGFAKTRLNPEPYAFESGYAVKWLIERQLKGDAALNYDPARGEVRAPWLSWGPYLWANGTTKRADGFYYEETDFTDADGTHESQAGQLKVGKELLKFFKTDSTTRGWFLKKD